MINSFWSRKMFYVNTKTEKILNGLSVITARLTKLCIYRIHGQAYKHLFKRNITRYVVLVDKSLSREQTSTQGISRTVVTWDADVGQSTLPK
jgi:sensor domain CHASE-containing protein